MKDIADKIIAVDLFCGIGGLSYGLRKSGIEVRAGFDSDESCKYAFEANGKKVFICKDVRELTGKEINSYYHDAAVKVLVGCAPCQPFSSYTYRQDKQSDHRWQLIYEFSRLIGEVEPDIVSMENVPQLLNFKAAPVFQDFKDNLKKLGYHNVWHTIVYAPDYGVPQKRKRLILLASKLGKISLIEPTHKPEEYVTVRDTIGSLEKLASGESSPHDFIHRCSKLSEKNLQRIRQSVPGGSWKRDWNDSLKLDCHKKDKGKTYVSIYGRMRWDEPSPTMTTLCTGIGNGRFGHPEQDRAISLREAALLQTFPKKYKFVDEPRNLKVGNISKHIGNAVPPKLGEVIGKSIVEHLRGHKHGEK
ncbi:MAG: DNA (cytosine-5-)-methyltransferase [Candidatus Electrothrix sp. AUS3]|nr:DNA (cytosine-5-)-methyltransferase [Candidatus Electrothrix gigas]